MLRMLLIILSIIILSLLIFGCVSYLKKSKDNRERLSIRLNELQNKFQQNSEDNNIRFQYAKKLFEYGQFSKSSEVLNPLINNEKASFESLYLMAHLEYLVGNYDKAEKIIHRIIANKENKLAQKIRAEIGLVFVYYQTLKYEKSLGLFKGMESNIQLPIWELMKSFKQERPYQIEWNGQSKTEVPFLLTDPLPVISVEIQGKQIYVIIDTGGETFYLDDEMANSLKIMPLVKQIEPFAGGKQIEVGYGRADSLKIGNMTLKSIPIKLGPISRFSNIISNNKYPIMGVLGTGELRQFLSTIDYLDGKLLLRPKTVESKLSLQEELKGKTVTKIPFVLALTHIIAAKGTLNDKDDLIFFIDSGLASSEDAMLAPKETLKYADIPIPKTERISDSQGGLGGGGFPVGRFSIEKLGLGPLIQKEQKGIYGVFPPNLYWECEFIVDGIISHQFLKKYQWTIDFSGMEMIFAK